MAITQRTIYFFYLNIQQQSTSPKNRWYLTKIQKFVQIKLKWMVNPSPAYLLPDCFDSALMW